MTVTVTATVTVNITVTLTVTVTLTTTVTVIVAIFEAEIKEAFGDEYKAFRTKYSYWRRRTRHYETSKKARDANKLYHTNSIKKYSLRILLKGNHFKTPRKILR